MLKKLALGLVLATLAVTATHAAVPMLLNYQGRLSAPDGTPKNGSFTMVFSFYDAEDGGDALPSGTPWSETQTVTVTDGVFNVLLGSVTALPATLFEGGPSDSAGPLRFLHVVVDGETLAPRRRVASAAYAISGGSASGSDVSVRVTHAASQFPLCSPLAVAFTVESWDTSDLFTPGTSRLTAQTPGKYLIYGNLEESHVTGCQGGRHISVLLNGATTIAKESIVPYSSSPSSVPLPGAQSISTHYELNAGDYVELFAQGYQIIGPSSGHAPVFGMVKTP